MAKKMLLSTFEGYTEIFIIFAWSKFDFINATSDNTFFLNLREKISIIFIDIGFKPIF